MRTPWRWTLLTYCLPGKFRWDDPDAVNQALDTFERYLAAACAGLLLTIGVVHWGTATLFCWPVAGALLRIAATSRDKA